MNKHWHAPLFKTESAIKEIKLMSQGERVAYFKINPVENPLPKDCRIGRGIWRTPHGELTKRGLSAALSNFPPYFTTEDAAFGWGIKNATARHRLRVAVGMNLLRMDLEYVPGKPNRIAIYTKTIEVPY